MDYEDYRRVKLESGQVYQDFIVDLMLRELSFPVMTYSSRLYQTTVGEGPSRVEIKHDEQYAKTGNLWIEIGEKARPRPGDYAPSGIFRDDNSVFYIIGDYDRVFLFGKQHLRLLAQSGRYPLIENRTRTSRGFLLTNEIAERLAMRVIAPKAEQKIVKAVGDLLELGRQLHRLLLRDTAQLSFLDENLSGHDDA